LAQALLDASGTTGRRRARIAQQFGLHRSILLERLDEAGGVASLLSWRSLVADLGDAIAEVRRRR
jgi:hypothetical protein